MAGKSVSWTRPKLIRFAKAYEAAKANGCDSFVFDGDDYLVSYAKYMLQFLAPKFDIEVPS
jgi:hypothetical protein